MPNWSDHSISDDYKKLKITPLQRKILDTTRRHPGETFGQIAARCGCGESHTQRTVMNFKAGLLGRTTPYRLKWDGEYFGTQHGGRATRNLKCLRCDTPIISQHKGHRFCANCAALLTDPEFSRDHATHGYSIYSVFEDRP